MKEDRNVNVITDLNGKKVVVINDIRFAGRQNISWNDVETYIKRFVGDFYSIAESSEIVYIGKDLPDEYAGSKYTRNLKGALARAKANASQGIPEMIEIAAGKRYKENLNKKHSKNASKGWYRYDTRFAIPVCDEDGEVIRYNIFRAELIVRCTENEKLYLYDIINIKKKQSRPPE